MTRQLDPSARILDLGCGYGRLAAQLADAGFENVVGYDSAPAMIKRGRAAFPNLTLKVGLAYAIPEPDNSCEAVVAAGLLTSVPDATSRAEIIAEMERLLVPGGTVFGVDFLIHDDIKYDEDGRFFSSTGIEMKHFTEQELSESFARFIDWESRQVPACSLSGNPAMALQYTVRLPANDLGMILRPRCMHEAPKPPTKVRYPQHPSGEASVPQRCQCGADNEHRRKDDGQVRQHLRTSEHNELGGECHHRHCPADQMPAHTRRRDRPKRAKDDTGGEPDREERSKKSHGAQISHLRI
jgi:SAM-dependent methyltransferase